MKIVKAHIFGFGKWVDHTFDFSKQSLICFYGENESGKTTLQQFIIFMMFGLPPRKRAAFKPKMSSKLGGRLILIDPSIGQFTIERIENETVCYLPDGETEDETWLHSHLNGMTEEMYRSIYSFSALDLSDIQEMKDESLGEILFSIGLTGATNIYTVERNLNKKIGDLFKPTGRVPAINKQVTTLEELYKDWSRYERQEASYRSKKERQLLLENDISRLEDNLNQYKTELFTLEKIRHALPTIQDYHQYNEKLKLFPEEMPFPENGVDRLNGLKKELIPLRSELDLLQENEREYRNKQQEISEQLYPDEQYETALLLVNEKQVYVEKRQSFQSIREKEEDLEDTIEARLKQLDIGVMRSDLIDLTFPFQIETIWKELSKEDELLELEKEQLLEEEHILLRKKDQLHQEISALKQKLLPDEHVQSLETKLNQDEHVKMQMYDRTTRKKDWLKTKQVRLKKANTLFYSSLVLALLFGIGGFVFNSQMLFILATLLGAAGFVQRLMTIRSITDMEKLLQPATNQGARPNVLTQKERTDIERMIHEQRDYQNELNLAEKEVKALHVDELKWEERERLFEQKQSKHLALVNEQQLQYSFLHTVSVPHWLDLLQELKQLKEKAVTAEELSERAEILNDEIKQFEKRIAQFFEKEDIPEREHTIETILSRVDIQRDLLREKEQYDGFLLKNLNKQRHIKKELSSYEDELNQLLKVAQVKTEEAFFEVANNITEYEKITESRETCLRQLSLTFSEGDKQNILKDIPNENKIDLSIKELEETEITTEQTIKDKRNVLAEVEAELSQMESSDDFSETIHNVQLEKDQLHKLALEWATLQTAKTALDQAKRAYRNKYLTEVIDKTSNYFSVITERVYERVFPPTENEPFLVESADHTRYHVGELSQGTVDQLYVSLRLAISEVMSERYNVPFIIDDAFVHFDSKRTNNIINILMKIGKNQQVILFTCKQDIKQLIPTHLLSIIEEAVQVD